MGEKKGNTMKTFKLVLASVALALALPAIAAAQGANLQGVQVQPFSSKWAADHITAVSTDVGIYVKYVGTAAGAATVEVDAATGDLTFISNGAAEDGFECPVSGALGGVIDVSNAACDTVGEVVDIINSGSNRTWIAVPHAMLRADSSNNTLITLSATDAKGPLGLGLLKDSAVALNVTNVVLPKDKGGAAQGMNWYTSSKNKLIQNPFEDRDTVLLYASHVMTTTDNAANLATVYCVVPNFVNYGNSTEAANVIYQEASALTTATGKIDEFVNAGGLSCPGGKLLVRTTGTTTLTAPNMLATGYVRVTTAH
jgi:hypothetical protein